MRRLATTTQWRLLQYVSASASNYHRERRAAWLPNALRLSRTTESTEALRQTPTLKASEAFPLIEVLGASMVGVNLKFDGPTASLPGDLDGSSQQRSTDPPTPMLGRHEEFVEPGHQTAVLQGPGEGEDRDADRFGVASQQDGASRRFRK